MALSAATAQPLRPDQSKLAALQALVSSDLERINKLIVERMESEVALIPQLAGHIVAGGGKRIRPMLTLIAAKLCGYAGTRHINLATCVEFIHTATLLHDDVVDDSDLRRGASSANAIWGNKAPVLVGDFLFSRAFQLMVDDGSLEVLRILAHASAVIAEGEVAQLLTTGDTSTSEQAHMDVIRAKTATLFAAAAEIGAVVAERSAREQEALRVYGESLGIAFQIIDDTLDYAAEQAALGKSIGDDFRDGKITMPVVLAYARGDGDERAFWQRTLEDGDQRDGDLDHAIRLMTRHNALNDSLARARAHGDRALAALDTFPPSPARMAMVDLVGFCIERAY